MYYNVIFSEYAVKTLKKIDRYQSRLILSWIESNLHGCSNPRIHGKSLAGDKKGHWRYRIGAYRIIAKIDDNKIIIEIINIGHRRDVYK